MKESIECGELVACQLEVKNYVPLQSLLQGYFAKQPGTFNNLCYRNLKCKTLFMLFSSCLQLTIKVLDNPYAAVKYPSIIRLNKYDWGHISSSQLVSFKVIFILTLLLPGVGGL